MEERCVWYSNFKWTGFEQRIIEMMFVSMSADENYELNHLRHLLVELYLAGVGV